MRWCLLLGLVALAMASSISDQGDLLANHANHAGDDFLNTTLFAEAPLHQLEHHQETGEDVETATDYLPPFEDDYLDEDGEYLPDPEALVDGEEEEEVVVLDAETRIVAEQLIQELDHISNKLQDDEETVGTSRAISSAEVQKLEKLLESAGLTPNSALLHGLMEQRQDAIPSTSLGPGMSGMAGLGSLLGGTSPVGSSGSSSLLAPGSMTKKNVEQIKVELKHMLFGPENQVFIYTYR